MERITTAAIWFKVPSNIIEGDSVINVNSGFVLTGSNHAKIYDNLRSYMYEDNLSFTEYINIKDNNEEGFLTNLNRFVNREEAGKIAFEARQIENLTIYLKSHEVEY